MADKLILDSIEFPYSTEYDKGYVLYSKDGLDTAAVHLSKKGSCYYKQITTYSRYLMETHLKRFLEKNERVFHIDKNKLNHSIDNLEIRVIGQSNNSTPSIISSRKPREYVELTCSYCKINFKKVKSELASAATNRFCSKGCQHKYARQFAKVSLNTTFNKGFLF